MSWWSTSERGYERGYFFTTFHCLTRVDLEMFFGGLVVFGFVFGLCWFGLVLLFCFPRFRDLFSSFAKSNDRRSCHGAHGVGEKKAINHMSKMRACREIKLITLEHEV